MPGDTIQMRDGVVIINGEEAPQEPAGSFSEVMEPQGPERRRPRCSNGPVGDGGACLKDRYIERLPNGVEHIILDIAPQASDRTGVYNVPQGHYFFMGDNRDNSADSRLAQQVQGVGFVPFENLIGRADRVMFSSAGRSMLFFWTWRSDRFFKRVE
jgi:signal peptidase I